MVLRLVSVFLIVAMSMLSRQAEAATSVHCVMKCCSQSHSSQSCPACPVSESGNRSCCSTCCPGFVLFFVERPAAFSVAFPVLHDAFISDDNCVTGHDRPLLPPPKIA